MKISIRKLDVLILCGYSIFIIAAIFLAFSFQSLEFTKWIQLLFWIVLSHICVTFFCMKLIGIKLFSLSGIFIALSYIFHLGQVLIKGITEDYVFSFDVSEIISSQIYIKSMLYSLVIISLVTVGMMLVKITKKETIKEKRSLKTLVSYKTIIKLGWIILLITFPIELYYSLAELFAASQLGYSAVLKIESSGILSQFARFHIIGFGLLIMGYSKKTRTSQIIFLLYTIYSVITMLSGSRIYPVLSIMILLYVLFKSTQKRLSLKTCAAFFIPGFFLVVILNSIAAIRLEGSTNINELYLAFLYSLSNNPLLDILEEFGSTIYTLCLTIIRVPLTVEYSHGLQFLTGFVSVLPNIGGIFTEINETLIFANYLNVEAIGGSYIAELYYSFQYTSYFVAIVLGYIIQIFSHYFEDNLEKKDFIKAAYLILPAFFLLLWVRGYYVGLLRNSVWAACFIYCMYMFLTKFSPRIKQH